MLKKRSISIQGHKTSISLEEEFWIALHAIAEAKNQSITQLIGEIDNHRPTEAHNLSSIIRVFILCWYQERQK